MTNLTEATKDQYTPSLIVGDLPTRPGPFAPVERCTPTSAHPERTLGLSKGKSRGAQDELRGAKLKQGKSSVFACFDFALRAQFILIVLRLRRYAPTLRLSGFSRQCTNVMWFDLRTPWRLVRVWLAGWLPTNTPNALNHNVFLIQLLTLLMWCPCYASQPGQHAITGQMLTEDSVATLIHRYVVQQGPWLPEQVEIALRSFSPVSLPNGPIDLQVLRPSQGVTPGVQSFLLCVMLGGKQIKTVWIRAEVRIFDDVMVTSRPLAYLEPITPDAVRVERREVGSLFARPYTKLEDVTTRQAARAIRVNQILTPALVQLPQVTRPGSPVTLVYETARLRIEVPGEAVEGGKIGDVIRVKNLSSGQLLEGQLIGAHIVMVGR